MPQAPRSRFVHTLPILQQAGSRIEYIIALLVNVLIWSIIDKIPTWQVPFLTARIVECLPALRDSVGVAIAGNAILTVYRGNWLKALLKIVMNIFGIIFIYTALVVFPFDFTSAGSQTDTIVTVVRMALVIGIAGSAAGLLLEFYQIIRGRSERHHS